MIESFFYACVRLIELIGDLTGLGYFLANILIFVFLQPTLILVFLCLWLKERRNRNLLTKSFNQHPKPGPASK